MPNLRQTPDQLLQRIQEDERKEHRGKLKIYLGAAPGVGKTYRMLHDAVEESKKGLDVVVGVVESHGRKEIEAMLEGMEILPKQKVEYHGRTILEFDLDAALKRNPTTILIDEMAHTNAPNIRHPKRWQDIKEILDRGINVYTTLNIQHIESLKDDISQIIQAPIRETVPDSIIDRADTIELVDIPPEELLQRLREGKVYIPEQAAIAVDNFFRKGNLTALRELALRITAKFVGAQVQIYRRGKKITRIWATKEKILVCVGPGKEAQKLIRSARRLVASFKAEEWIAVFVDSPKLNYSPEERNNAMKNLRFARELGADIHIITEFDLVKAIMNYAREQNVTLIMIWKHIRFRLRDIFYKNLADELVRHCGEINVFIMTGDIDEKTTKLLNIKKQQNFKIDWKSYGISLTIVGVVTCINLLLYPFLNTSNILIIYLLGVSVIALLGEAGPSVFGAILSILLYGFFFIYPYYSIAISDIQYFVTLIIMLIVGQIISHLINLTRRQARMALNKEHQTSALYRLSLQLANTRGSNKLLEVGTQYISKLFNSKIIPLMQRNSHLSIIGKGRKKEPLSDKEKGVAQWVFDLGQMAGLGTDTLPLSDSLYVPLQGSQKVLGVLRIMPQDREQFSDPEQLRLLEACANQIALALEVDRLQEETKASEFQEESDRVRNKLLQSVSHDLRTPVVFVMAASSKLMDAQTPLDVNKANKLGNEIYLEGEQLNRLISNLLQIAYLESEAIKLEKQACSLKDLILHVVTESSKKLGKRSIITEIPDDLPLIPLDRTLIEDVFNNLIDNALKFTPQDTSIEIKVVVQMEKDRILVSVEDYGPGIADDERDKLFEKFYRGRLISSQRGLGLGLAICKKIITAHGGQIWAENKEQGGAAFYFTLRLIE